MDNEKDKLIKAIMDACEQLNWSIAIPDDDHGDNIRGLIIGTDEYIGEILAINSPDDFFGEDGDDYDEEMDDQDMLSNFNNKNKRTTH